MRRWLEEFEEFAIEVILDRRHGRRASILRVVLKAFSHLYKAIVLLRLWLFKKRIFRQRQVGCMVISIGNLTVGGTGKTPVVEKFARALQSGGRNVAILSRGYKSKKLPLLKRLIQHFKTHEYKPRIVSDGRSILLDSSMAGDEPFMLATNLKDVVVLVDKNRVASALYASDIVLVDRQAPFGNEHLLPRGTLREPPENLKRAHYIFITKSTPEGNAELIQRIRKYNRTAEIIECAHRPQYLEHVHTGERIPLNFLEGKYIGAFSAIASPESFERALRELGANIQVSRHFADHHRFTDKELKNFIKRCVNRDLAAIITTEKDSVRLPRLDKWEIPIYFLRVEIEIYTGHQSWQNLVDRICKPQPFIPPEKYFE